MHTIIAAQELTVAVTVPMLHLQVLDKETLQAQDASYLLHNDELTDDELLFTAHAELLRAQSRGLRVLGSSTAAVADEVVLGVAA